MLIKLLTSRLPPYRRDLIAVCILQLLSTLASLSLPALNGDIIDNGVARGDTGYIWRVGGWMLAASLLQIVCAVGAVWSGARASMGMGRDLRAALVGQVLTFSQREVTLFGAPTLITRSTNDVQQLQQLVFMGMVILVSAPIMAVGGVVMALREDVGLSWLVAVAVPTLLTVVTLVIRRMVPLFRLMQTRLDAVNRVLREQIGGIRVVRAFVREQQERQRFGRANDELTDAGLRAGYLMAMIFPIVMLIMNVSTVAVLWFGAHRVDAGQVEVGSIIAYISYLIQILMSVMMATMVATMIPRASVSADRITAVLDTPTSVVVPDRPEQPRPELAGVVELRGATFSYPGAESPVFSGVSFVATPGTVTAIVGATGAGKTTLVNLVPRLFDVSAGQVLVDGVDVRDMEPEQLWRRVAIVPQRPYLFSGTVASNLRYGKPDATDAELWHALDVAQAHDFVTDLDGGLAAPIAQAGSNVSGGQRQRLCIARALVAKPRIYLFDDSFSALDLGTDARLRAALRPCTRSDTVIIVAQRVSTILEADQIIVLEAGRVAGVGTHEELLSGCPTYREIVESQLTSQDAA